MNKCSHCGAILKTLTRVCEACGSEIKPEASGSSASLNQTPASPDAAELSTQINESLATLKAQAPNSKINAFAIGLFLVPTLGLSYLVVKILTVFGRIGRSPERVKLALDQNLRAAETSFKSDPEMKALMEKGRSELNAYIQLQQEARKSMAFGLAAFIIIGVAINLVIQHEAKLRLQKAALAQQQAVLTQVERVAEEAKAGKEKAVQEYAELLKQSLTAKSSAKVEGIKRIAVLVADNKQSDPALTQSLAKLMQATNTMISGGMFTESFVESGLFEKVFKSDSSAIADLNLAKVTDELLLVKKTVTFTARPEYGMTDANMSLNFKFIDANSGAVLDGYTFEGTSEAFSGASAEAEAGNKILKQFVNKIVGH